MTQTPVRFPPPRSCPLEPPPALARLREEAPVSRVELANGQWAWLVTRYEDVRSSLRDARLSADATRPGFPALGPTAFNPRIQSFGRMDDPRHAVLRRMLIAEFAPKRLEALRPDIRAIITDRIRKLEQQDPPVDLIASFALAIPSLVISRILGVPYEDHEFFEKCAGRGLSADPEQSRQASDEILDYMDRLVAAKERQPGDDLISRVVVGEFARGNLSHVELVAMMRLLLVGGHETTANLIGLGVLSLLREPGTLAKVRTDPERMRNAVEELLRLHTINHWGVPRIALQDIEIGGQRIGAGDGVLVSLTAANYDLHAFASPDELDVERESRHHVAFGYGIHQCLGQNLARIEIQEAIQMLFERFPGLRLATPLEQLRFKEDRLIYGLYALPVTWES